MKHVPELLAKVNQLYEEEQQRCLRLDPDLVAEKIISIVRTWEAGAPIAGAARNPLNEVYRGLSAR